MKKGYQLYSAREKCETPEGLISVLKQLALFGYDGVEFFDYRNIPADELKAILRENHLVSPNSHVALDRWRNNLDGEIQYALTAGIAALTIPYIVPERRTEADYRNLLKEIPKYAATCEAAGIRFCYHNHDFEFSKLDGQYVLDVLLSADKRLMFELDTFWAFFAGEDPCNYLKKYAGRVPYIHIKDYIDKNTTPPVFCALGEGNMENDGLLKAAAECEVGWIVVEQDNSRIDVMESARISVEYLIKKGV
jgi:sugar phosphate isomerase/epimerase